MTNIKGLFEFSGIPRLTTREAQEKVVIVGAGPVGLAAALELANHGIRSVVVDKKNSIARESRAICWSKRSLEIFDRLGIGDKAVDKGVTWKVGRTFYRDQELFSFDLLPEEGHKYPAFVNLQQYYVEEYLLEKVAQSKFIDLRFFTSVIDISQQSDTVKLELETPAGNYFLETDWLIACDGVRSPVRKMLNLKFEGEFFEDSFLIVDIEMKVDFPSERRFWFEPVFHEGQSALLHKQPDNMYRIDLQLGSDPDPEYEGKPEIVASRIENVVGSRDFHVDWVSIYKFQCRRMEKFLHNRVIFAGDSAHEVSPFGARGGNGGLQDVDSLCWRLAAVIKGAANSEILSLYNSERVFAADENIANSTLTTKFMTPADGWERVMRDQVLQLASKSNSVRSWVNSGRLSVPCVYPSRGSDDPDLPVVSRPGAVSPDVPQPQSWLLENFGVQPTILGIGCTPPQVAGCRSIEIEDNEYVRLRYLGSYNQAIYLLRPDQVIAARWATTKPNNFERAISNIWKTSQ